MGAKIFLAALLAHALLFGAMIHHSGAEGFAPGEPSPNKGDILPGDIGSAEKKAEACPLGMQRYPVLECASPKMLKKRVLSEDCVSYTPVLKCHKRPFKLHCKKGTVTRERVACVKLKSA